MSNYTKSTNFATKDNLSPGDPLKIVRGTEIDTEFNNISTAISTKTDNSAAAITGGSITGITDLAVADGGTGASTATAALNNLLPSQTSNANKYLQTDGTNATWDAVSLSTADITGTLPVANGGTGVTSSTGTGSVVLSNSPTLVTPALGTPASGVATNLTGLPISTGVSGLGTGVATFLGTPSSANLISAVTDETGTGSLVFANSPTLVTPALGTPSALVGTNITGTASGLTAGNVTTNANLTGAVTSVGNATSLGSFSSANLLGALTDETGSGSAVFATSPTLVTPILGTPTSATLTNATGLPIATGVSGLGTGVATALAVNVGSSGAPLVNGGVLGTPSSGTATNLTGLPLTTGVTGTLPTANGGTNLTSFTSGGVVYASSSSALATGSTLTFDGATLVNSTNSNSGTYIVNRNISTGTAATSYVISDTTAAFGAYTVFGSRSSGFTTSGMLEASSGGLFSVGLSNGLNIMTIDAHPVKFGVGNTEGMRLTSSSLYTASGINVGIGTTSPAYKLDVAANTNGAAVIRNRNIDSGSSAYSGFQTANNATANAGGVISVSNGWADSGLFGPNSMYIYSTSGKLAISAEGANPILFATNSTERMRIDSAGNLGLGVTPSAWSAYKAIQTTGASFIGYSDGASNNQAMVVANAFYDSGANWKYIYTDNASRYQQLDGQHIWYNAPSGTAGDAISFTQAATLTANGNYLLGTTTDISTVRMQVWSSSSDNTAYFRNSNATPYGPSVAYTTASPNNTGSEFLFCQDSTAVRISLRSNGGIANYSANDVNLSDERTKTDIQNAGSYLSKICAIPVRTFKYKDQTDDFLNLGVIAQEVEVVAPELVDTTGFGETPEDGVPLKSIYQTDMQYALMKALQELKSEFDAYKAAHP